MGPGDLEDKLGNGDADRDKDADLDRLEDDAEKGAQQAAEVELVRLPDEIRRLPVKQPEEGADDDHGQDALQKKRQD